MTGEHQCVIEVDQVCWGCIEIERQGQLDENARLTAALADAERRGEEMRRDLPAILARLDFGRNPVITEREREVALADVSDALRSLIGRAALSTHPRAAGDGAGRTGYSQCCHCDGTGRERNGDTCTNCNGTCCSYHYKIADPSCSSCRIA